MAYELNVKRVANGFILKYDEELDEGTKIITEQIVEEDDTASGELEAAKRMLWQVLDHFALGGSKHDTKRIVICYRNDEGELVDE